ncbi:MAG: hypothetical protein ACRDRI_05415 [Pseudonocardiaceae bacterium]
MAVHLRLARALALTAISLAVTGAAAPAGAATVLKPSHALITTRVDAPSGWMTTTDPVSGISVMLPGQPTVKNTTTTSANGDTLPLRQYILELNGGSRTVVFQVIDAPFRPIDFDKGLQLVASTQGNGMVTTSRHFTLDGHPADDSRITGIIEGTPAVSLVRFVADSGYLVAILTVGRSTEESGLIPLHQEVLGTLHLV